MRKLDKVIREARDKAKLLGHNLFWFTHCRDVTYLATAFCKKCCMYVGVDTKRFPSIEGSAITLYCPHHDG